ncbi:hypothetical protein SISSUDRAFT_80661, partial [Sistotremastrum suecicum HHB10207 ss-3]
AFEIPGSAFEPLDPALKKPRLKSSKSQEHTWLMSTPDLTAISLQLYEKLREDAPRLPKLPVSPTFPYRNEKGLACFVCEDDHDGHPPLAPGRHACRYCPHLDLEPGPKLIEHMAMHFLHDVKCADLKDECGFCGSTEGRCATNLMKSKHTQSKTAIDMDRTRCPNKYKIALASAAKFTPGGPCTNVPIQCRGPGCDQSPCVWKYNMLAHFETVHKNDIISHFHEEIDYRIEQNERNALNKLWDHEKTVKHRHRTAKKQDQLLPVSEAHRAMLTMRTTDLSVTATATATDINGSATSNTPEPNVDALQAPSADANNSINTSSTNLASNSIETVTQPSNHASVPVSTTRASRSQVKKRRIMSEEPEDPNCDYCGLPGNGEQLLGCSGPLCGGWYHLICSGEKAFPRDGEDWWCDDDCRINSGARLHNKRRKT